MPDDELPEKYGPSAVTLNYPNHFDLIEGKTGYGIWLHGVIEDKRVEEANVTEGCVAFYNADILQIKDWLTPNQSVVIISTDKSAINKAEDIAAIREKTKKWGEAWAARLPEVYGSFYAKNFQHSGRSYEQYIDYKKNVFKTYNKMDVKLSNIQVLTHPKYAVSLMNQDFNGDNRFVHNGRKLLYWVKDEAGQWVIASEIYQASRFESQNLTTHLASSNPQSNTEGQTPSGGQASARGEKVKDSSTAL